MTDQQHIGASRSYDQLMRDDGDTSSRLPSNREYHDAKGHFSQGRSSIQTRGKNGELSSSFLPDEIGSAEAMEYTPSNTSVNNSLPTHLVTQSNSNINMSNTKGSHQLNQFQSSPSPTQLEKMMLVSNYQ
jgi:hypothetical protein